MRSPILLRKYCLIGGHLLMYNYCDIGYNVGTNFQETFDLYTNGYIVSVDKLWYRSYKLCTEQKSVTNLSSFVVEVFQIMTMSMPMTMGFSIVSFKHYPHLVVSCLILLIPYNLPRGRRLKW